MNEKASVKLSLNSWHYKLIKFVLGSGAPTPSTMHNLCPYFWLLIFSLIAVPFVAPVKGFIKLGNALGNGLSKILTVSFIEPAAKDWEKNLTDLDIFEIWNWEQEINKYFRSINRGVFSYNREEFVYDWWKKKYGESPIDPQNTKLTDRFNSWLLEMRKLSDSISEYHRQEAEAQILIKERRKEKLRSFSNGLDSIFSSIGKSIASQKNIIKWTKRFVGLIITAAGLALTFLVVNYMGRGILWVIDNLSFTDFLIILVGLSIVFGFIGFIKFIGILYDYLSERGRKSFFVNILYYLVMGLYFPLKWIFYDFIFRFILVNFWKLLKKAGIGLWDGLLGFLGIFGEYFGASYSDYCPGIEWEEEK
jgi:hypothetical protein